MDNLTIQDKKDLVEIESKKVELIYKKLVVLLATAGGSGAYFIKFLENGSFIFGTMFGVVFSIMALGVAVNYDKLNKTLKKIEEIENGRIRNTDGTN